MSPSRRQYRPTKAEQELLDRLTQARHPPRSAADEIEWTEPVVQRCLNKLVGDLMKAADDAMCDERLSLEDRALYLRQRDILSTAVADLIARLPDPEDRFSLLKALGSTVLIVYEAAEHLDAPVRELKRTASGSRALSKQGAVLKTIILAALKREMKQISPAYPEKRRHIITRVLAETNAQLPDADKVKRDCVRKHLTKYWNENPASAPPK
jgi:hypothetical protein